MTPILALFMLSTQTILVLGILMLLLLIGRRSTTKESGELDDRKE